MQSQLALDSLPQPGEPLTPHTDENNQALLDSEVHERIARQNARLTWKQRWWLNRRFQQLKRKLNKAEYNPLIKERWECYQRYQQLKHQINSEKNKKLIAELKRVKARGIELNHQLEQLKPLVDEFDLVVGKLNAHRELLEWEREDRENFEAFKREARTWEQQLLSAFRQSPRLHHRGTDEKGRYFTIIPIIREIIVKDDRVLYHIKTTGQTLFERLLGRWHSALPYGVDVSSLICEETLENLKASCNRVVTVERSKRGTNLYYVISRLDSPDGIPKRVLYQKVIDWYPTKDHSKTPWCAGLTNDRKTEWFNFEDFPHILIAGSTYGGKSNHINQIIATVATMNSPDELRLLLIDLKGGMEFTHWKHLQHQLRPMLTTELEALEGFQWLHKIMDTRKIAFASIEAKTFASYNEKVKQKIPRIICVVDEMATFVGHGELTKDLHTELRVLCAQGRAVGIHLVLCTQHSSVDILPGWIKTNMGVRISGKMPTHSASEVILGTGTAATLPNIAGRMVFRIGSNEIIAQSPYISDEQIASSIQVANAFKQPDNTEFIFSLPQPEPAQPPFTKDDVLRFALEMNGKLSANRIHDIVGNEVIRLRDLRVLVNSIKDDLEKGTITYQDVEYRMERRGRAYVLIAIEPAMEQKRVDTMVAS